MKRIYGRVDSGFYCREAVEAYEEFNARFVISARKTSRLVEQLRQAEWKPSPKTDGDAECEFRYQPDGWKKQYRFVALRYEKAREEMDAEESEQYQLFETSQYKYRVFVTDFSDPIDFVVWFYNQRGGAENLIKEANNDAGLAAHPWLRFDVNGNHFQLAMLAYNLNCWLMLFHREPQADARTQTPAGSGQTIEVTPKGKAGARKRLRATVTSPITARRMEAYIELKVMSQTSFANQIGTTDRTLRKFRKTGKIRRDIFHTIAKAIGIPPEEALLKPE